MQVPEFARRYQSTLVEFIEGRTEAALERAYALGRHAIAAGMGVLDVAAIHHEAVRLAPAALSRPVPTDELLAASQCCFAELLAVFEITLRASRDANLALRHFNDTLEREIKRVAQALHGETGQLLAATQIAVGQLQRSPADVAPGLAKIESLVQAAANQLRQVLHELQPTVLHDLGLLPALDFLRQGIVSRTGLLVTVEGRSDARYPQAMETAMYRVVQEALNNIVKHAAASKVSIRIEQGAGLLVCTVHDDGKGFDPARAARVHGERGFGLLGMRERLGHLGGSLQIDSSPGHGTTVLARIPLSR